ncbi:MAG: hypothetical protein ACXVHL_35880 [Solirubrobacteraceae bacterium]
MSEDRFIAAMRQAQEEIDAAEAARANAIQQFEDAMREAHERGGYSFRALGEMLGVSGQRVHQILYPKPR